MNLNRGTRTLLVALTVAGSALVVPTMALAETPAPEGPIGPVDVANPIDEPEPEPCDDPGDCLTNPTEPEPCDDPGDCLTNPTDDPDDGGDDGDAGDGHDGGDDTDGAPPSDIDEPVLANPTFTG
jgi:hypothetical protein